MYFNKYPYASNFEFVHDGHIEPSGTGVSATFTVNDFKPETDTPYQEQTLTVCCVALEQDVYSIRVSGPRWPRDYAQSELVLPPADIQSTNQTRLALDADFGLTLTDRSGTVILKSSRGCGFGISGKESAYQFERLAADRFYGMGEKVFGFEHSKRDTKFWNTDVWADHSMKEIVSARPDPYYVSIPYLIIHRGGAFIGLLLDNPYATYIKTGSKVTIANQQDADAQPPASLTLGAEHGQPNLMIIYGPTLAALTEKLQRIVGVTPLPPAWSLGYHQCRWGYESIEDLRYLDAAMDRFEIPCDGLWLDIDYMRGYRVFTFEDEKNFPDVKKNIADIQDKGRRVVPILDPGVKAEAGYAVYESGKDADIFCKNPQGQDFIGLVWPGETVFPDYSLPTGRSWWSGWVQRFAESGISAAWLDMNDPATGAVSCTDMLFNKGKDSHYTYHNQYALGMAKASREGFAAAFPNDRPFLLCRSGFTGTSKYTAIWTGDNCSNYHHLKTSIACTLNLALSGVPFNGPDVGGFGGNTTPELLRDWHKAGFLFPFFRNHCVCGAENQEPWLFGRKNLDIYRDYIRLRYLFRPYLYNLFVAQEERGSAILRPLFYDFEETPEVPLGYVDDQFMVGPTIMQAPFVEEDAVTRSVSLPDCAWYSALDAGWINGNQMVSVDNSPKSTPIYFRDGAIIPTVPDVGGENDFVSNDICFLIFMNQDSTASETIYTYDDGQSYDYRDGKRSRLKITADVDGDTLSITTEQLADGYGPCQSRFVVFGTFAGIRVNGQEKTFRPQGKRLAGVSQPVLMT